MRGLNEKYYQLLTQAYVFSAVRIMGSWHLTVGDDRRIYLMKGEEKMKSEGNFKDGKRPYIGPITDVRHHTKSDKTYLLVRT